MPSREEILKALETIKSTCEQQEECATCPLRIVDKNCYSDYGCALNNHDNPTDWKIIPREESWRAFED